MTKLPEKFPEYLIMYKTLTKKISELDSKSEQDKIKNTRQKEPKSKTCFLRTFLIVILNNHYNFK